MAKWADKKSLATETLVQEEKLTERSNGGEGNQTDARMKLLEGIADNADTVRAQDLEDVTDEMYDNPTGTGGEATEEEQTEETTEETEQESVEQPRKLKLKINGVDQELTEEEVIARAQKVSSADQYLAEAAKLYKEATTSRPPVEDDANEEQDDVALARAIQMGSEEEAVKAIQSIKARGTLSKDEMLKAVDTRLEQRTQFQREVSRFQTDYKDLIADPDVNALILDLDESYARSGEAPGYDRFKKAAESVKKAMKVQEGQKSMKDREERKASARTVVGQSSRPAPRTEEREPTTSETIASMAKSRGQFVRASH